MAAYVERPTAEVQAFILLCGIGGQRAAIHRECLEKKNLANILL